MQQHPPARSAPRARAAAMAGLTCQTAPNTVFADMDELKAHYKSDWHRYNLKRKVCLPCSRVLARTRCAPRRR